MQNYVLYSSYKINALSLKKNYGRGAIRNVVPISFYIINSLGSIVHICAHLFRTFRVHSAYMRAFEIIHANCHGCLPSFVEQGTQLDQPSAINYISCHLRYVWMFPHNTTTNTSGWLDLPFTIPGKREALAL